MALLPSSVVVLGPHQYVVGANRLAQGKAGQVCLPCSREELAAGQVVPLQAHWVVNRLHLGEGL